MICAALVNVVIICTGLVHAIVVDACVVGVIAINATACFILRLHIVGHVNQYWVTCFLNIPSF